MRQIVEPKKPLKFVITEKHCKNAERNNACECVIAKAFMDEYKNKLLEVQVLATVTCLVWSGGAFHRYQTPNILREALRDFDRTGQWNLPAGEYMLMPIPKSQTKKAIATRAATRRATGDSHMTRRYPFNGKNRQRPMNPRLMNLRALRDASATAK